MKIYPSSFIRITVVLLFQAVYQSSVATAEITFNVFAGSSCDPEQKSLATVMANTPQEIGYCQNHGIGASAYNSMEVISCTDTCFCFRQVAAETEDVNCDTDRAIGGNIKMSCFGKCLQDCNGPTCGETMKPDSFITRLQLTGEGPICQNPVSEEDFVCENTGMIKDSDGNLVDDFVRDTPVDWSLAEDPRGNSAAGQVDQEDTPPEDTDGEQADAPVEPEVEQEDVPADTEDSSSGVKSLPMPFFGLLLWYALMFN